MLETWVPPVVALAYVVVLFLVAYMGDRLHRRGVYVPTPIVYSLALGVYCTSWTFFGAVGMSATRGWDFLTIYLGPIIVFLMMTRLPARIVEVSKRQSITSVADFIASRYGKAQGIAALASVMALVTVLPYIALQLKAVSGSYSLITGGAGHGASLPRVSARTPAWSRRPCWPCSPSCSARARSTRPRATAAWCWPSPSSRRSSWWPSWRSVTVGGLRAVRRPAVPWSPLRGPTRR
jgi:hypothetical protein